MYKETICHKLGSGKKFSRLILYTRQNAIRIGLIALKMAIAMLATKLYIRNKQANIKIRARLEFMSNQQS